MKLNIAIIAFIIFCLLVHGTCQVVDLAKDGASKWPDHEIPYVIDSTYTENERELIERAIQTWNSKMSDFKLTPRNQEADYVYVFPGKGCWSYLGRRKGKQELSLQKNGCLYQGIILHQFMHAAGFTHTQNRHDRDGHIEILWDNIPEDWKAQYEKSSDEDYNLIGNYNSYSIMRYPVNAPGTAEKAFTPKTEDIEQDKVGNNVDFTDTDMSRIESMCQ